MQMSSETTGSDTVVTITGRIDAVTAPDLETRLFELIDGGATQLILAFSPMEYISSAGLRVVLSAAKKLKTVNGGICLAGLQGTVREVFEISGFFAIFKVFETVDEARGQV